MLVDLLMAMELAAYVRETRSKAIWAALVVRI
jgi:hypothetical protein